MASDPRQLSERVWLRACVLHPLAFVGPWVVLFWLAAEASGSNGSPIVDYGIAVIPIAAVLSWVATIIMASRRRASALVIAAGAVASGVALVVGMIMWAASAEIACHGAANCPL